jgi:LysR family glycine cleavage system transcriptional activator
MTAAAAVHGMGLALVPKLLIQEELTRGELVVACNRPLTNARAYYLVLPVGGDPSVAAQTLLDWLLMVVPSAP